VADYPKGPVSHSQVSGYLRCSKQFELERISQYPAPPAWYFIGGTAVHNATEAMDRIDPIPIAYSPEEIAKFWSDAYEAEIEAQFLTWPADEEWLKFGRKGSEQGHAYWFDRGLEAVNAYWAWRLAHPEFLLESIEERFDVVIDGIQFTGRIDRVFQTPKGRIIVDLKTGTRRPESGLQLALYRMGYELSHGLPEGHSGASGGWFMTKDGELHFEPIAPFTNRVLSGILKAYLAGVRQDVFLPNVGPACFSCAMKQACAAVSGPTPEALRYDSLLRS